MLPVSAVLFQDPGRRVLILCISRYGESESSLGVEQWLMWLGVAIQHPDSLVDEAGESGAHVPVPLHGGQKAEQHASLPTVSPLKMKQGVCLAGGSGASKALVA